MNADADTEMKHPLFAVLERHGEEIARELGCLMKCKVMYHNCGLFPCELNGFSIEFDFAVTSNDEEEK